MVHNITVDVEEYYHATNLERVIGPQAWHTLPSRVERSTKVLLDLFAKHDARGTFFILGCVARRHPSLVKEISAAGHEVASHGYAHRLAYEQTPRAFARDVRKSKFLLENLIGKSVLGYRAPNFSIRDNNAWAYDELIAAGYLYDSSLFPVRHHRYGNREKPAEPYRLQRPAGSLLILPVAVCDFQFFGRSVRLPVAGGAYWRHLPLSLMEWGLKHAAEQRALNCYLHPWELDGGQPRFDELPLITRFRHYGGIQSFGARLDSFLGLFPFRPLAESYDSLIHAQ